MEGGLWGIASTESSGTIRDFQARAGSERVRLLWTAEGVGPLAYVISRAEDPAGPYAVLHSVPAVGSGTYELVDTSAAAGIRSYYLVAEEVVPLLAIPRALAEAAAYGASLPSGVVRVGPSGFANLDVALAAAPQGATHWTVILEPGSYPSFTVDASAPGELRIVGDGMGTVSIDTSTGPILVQDRGPEQVVELRGLQLGQATSDASALRVVDCEGVVLLDQCEIQSTTSWPGLHVSSSSRLVVQRCSLSGIPGLQLDQNANAVLTKSHVAGIILRDQARLQSCEVVNTGALDIESSSIYLALAGMQPEIETPAFVGSDQPHQITVRGRPFDPYQMFVSLGSQYLEIPPHELPLLLHLGTLHPFSSGVTNGLGTARQSFEFPSALAELYGRSFSLQLFVVEPRPLRARFSCVNSMIALP
jgi:hypothetical protein